MRRRGLARGFGLLEALVALAIAALAFTALYRTVGQSAKVVMDVDARIQASMLARSVLASATFAEDLEPLRSGQAGPWQWTLSTHNETVSLQAADGQALDVAPVSAVRVQVLISREGQTAPVLSWTGWKPLRPVRATTGS